MHAQVAYASDPEVKSLMESLKRIFFGDQEEQDPDSIEVRAVQRTGILCRANVSSLLRV